MKVWLKKFPLEIEEIKDKEIETLTEREWGNWNAQPFESSCQLPQEEKKTEVTADSPTVNKKLFTFLPNAFSA